MVSFKFNNITQKEKQFFADFETDLRKQVQYCEYKCECGKSYEDRMLVDQIIIGVNDKKLQLKLLDTKNEKLIDIIDKCKAFEVANQNKSLLDKNIVHQAVHSVESKECTPSESINAISRRCYNCGSTFGPGHLNECKAKTINCHSCGRRGHFSRFCKQCKEIKM